MPSMTIMEIRQTPMNTLQQIQMGKLVYIRGPIQRSPLPTAVAPSQRPWQRPSRFFGATLETKLRPRGLMKSSATVMKK